MSEINDGGPAFPVELHATTKDCKGFDGEIVKAGHVATYGGMTLRDYFASKAMPACYYEVCRECDISGWPEDWKTGVAMDAYAMADAMLAERNRQK